MTVNNFKFYGKAFDALNDYNYSVDFFTDKSSGQVLSRAEARDKIKEMIIEDFKKEFGWRANEETVIFDIRENTVKYNGFVFKFYPHKFIINGMVVKF
jgi:hypothetical protein